MASISEQEDMSCACGANRGADCDCWEDHFREESAVPAARKPWLGASMDDRCVRIYMEYRALSDFHMYNDYRAYLEQSVDSLRDLLEENRTEWLALEKRLEKPDLAPETRADLEARNAEVKGQGDELWAEFEAFNEEWRRYNESAEEPEPDENWVRAMIGNPGRDI